jgi:hypothetical protein
MVDDTTYTAKAVISNVTAPRAMANTVCAVVIDGRR